ncbi:hypothetical protein [uncultured Chryseobacterium sp.]|uniref:hypothetical protein n=1 Tax=uncultured Chryseobacterium sp. TaxID=259322 RepID=UPI0025E2DD22|nr:hypothetical protein [uncultured Chryseobacterium sp.]
MQIKTLFIILFSVPCINIYAQVGIGTSAPKAALDIQSVKQGILIPRMTAVQAEAINSPSQGELIYSISSNGTIINNVGFWYYDGTVWRPFGASLQPSNTLYNSNGTLASDRTVTMGGKNLSYDSDKMILLAANQRIGIGETLPKKTLDVNGNVRVRNLTAGNVVATSDGTLSIGAKVPYGTVKESFRTTDHNGWYKLDGRAVNTLSPAVQANASALGITGSLINANNLLLRQGSTMSTGGNSNITLVKANLPNYTMTGTTSESGLHTHSMTGSGSNFTDFGTSGGNASVFRAGRGTNAGNVNTSLVNVADHVHTGSIASGGNGTAFSIIPQTMAYTYFIYLGQ